MAVSNPEFEAECIRRILAGERQLFHSLIRPCERAIYFLLLSLLHNEAEAEDAAQETAIKVYLNLHAQPKQLLPQSLIERASR
jgi:RNA polymerase sigma-70 factor (ECF subfamily)